MKYIKSKYQCFFSAQWVFRYAGMDVIDNVIAKSGVNIFHNPCVKRAVKPFPDNSYKNIQSFLAPNVRIRVVLSQNT